jgi:hypothetical protein
MSDKHNMSPKKNPLEAHLSKNVGRSEHEDMVGDITADPAYEFDDPKENKSNFDQEGGLVEVRPIEDVPMEELKQIRLSRKRTVMKLQGDLSEDPSEGFSHVSFISTNDDDNSVESEYLMLVSDWEAFGKPTVITVGVVNGDILN